MKRYARLIAFLFALAALFQSCGSEPQTLPVFQSSSLDSGWLCGNLRDTALMKTDLPGSVQGTMERNGVLPDAFFANNAEQYESLEYEKWQYQRAFRIPSGYDYTTLVLEGIDTHAEVSIDGLLEITTDNMFREYVIALDYLDTATEHFITIEFEAPYEATMSTRSHLYVETAGNDDFEQRSAPYSRKAQYQFGWDWAPRMQTMGLESVRLEQWNRARLHDVHVETLSLTDERAEVALNVTLESDREAVVSLALTGVGQDTTWQFPVMPGERTYQFTRTILNPKRWWTNGLGDPHLYEANLALQIGGQTFHEENVSFGLRTLELIQEEDSIGHSYEFVLNDLPVFMKGANYVPQDVFLERVTPEDYQRLIEDMADANMNMVRVWGGGVYERDIFYDLCDQHGLLVWQDFMFAGAMYPGHETFVDNVRAEAEYQVKRLRNHPCLALWCGNNEIDVAWHNWGWQDGIGIHGEDSVKMYAAYEKLFKEVLPAAVSEHDGGRPYVHTSPLSNWGTPENFNHSSMHYWGVWHGDDYFADFADNVPRFMVEYGFQSYPDLANIRTFTDSTSLSLESKILTDRQKSYKGNGLLHRQMAVYYPEPANFSEWLYLNQLVQAKAYEEAIDEHRKKSWHCRGTLYWQLNDCWPGPSWSTIDYFGNWKAAHYRVRDQYRPLQLSVKWEAGFFVFISNHLNQLYPEELQIDFVPYDGGEVIPTRVGIQTMPMQDDVVAFRSVGMELAPGQTYRGAYRVRIADEDSVWAERIFHPRDIKERIMPDPQLKWELEQDGDQWLIHLTAETWIEDLYLWLDDYDPREGPVRFSDNFVDLTPGQQLTITLDTRGNADLVLDPARQLRLYCIGSGGTVITL